jgi:hypothetical protein
MPATSAGMTATMPRQICKAVNLAAANWRDKASFRRSARRNDHLCGIMDAA